MHGLFQSTATGPRIPRLVAPHPSSSRITSNACIKCTDSNNYFQVTISRNFLPRKDKNFISILTKKCLSICPLLLQADNHKMATSSAGHGGSGSSSWLSSYRLILLATRHVARLCRLGATKILGATVTSHRTQLTLQSLTAPLLWQELSYRKQIAGQLHKH